MPSRRASARRVDKLVTLLEKISNEKAHSSELVSRFQSLYGDLPKEDRPLLFDALLDRMEIQRGDVEGTLKEALESNEDTPVSWTRRLTKLRRGIESPRVRAFGRFLATPGGLPFLLEFRAAVLKAQRELELELDPLDGEIAHLFNSWFQSGFLLLREITLESSFREIRFLKEHDMVHPMANLDEMGTRLGEDRRLFALFHRAMPEEPIVFIEAALTGGMVRSIHDILSDASAVRSKGARDTATFYSINNTQDGLVGLGLGKALVSEVMKVIRRDDPGIKVFSTLSPIPGMWEGYLERILAGDDSGFELKRAGLERFFSDRSRGDLIQLHSRKSGRETSDFPTALREILADPRWIEDEDLVPQLDGPLIDLAYFYITKEKNRRGKPLNSVAAFHLGNGARVAKANVNFGANRSERGLRESCGLMVNYVYSMNRLRGIGLTVQSLASRRR